jgi:hypothetical protein
MLGLVTKALPRLLCVEVRVFFDMSNKGENFLFGNLWFWELITAIGDSVLCIVMHVVKRK